ncbi:MAG TPA: ABC transporter permease, partial [Solirubrobacteraceae bacterium]
DRAGRVSQISAAAQPGISEDELARRIRAVLPRSATVRTAAAQSAKDADDVNSSLSGFLTPALLAFAGAAILVGAFIIYNTFSITIAQRTREFGLLRALGARRRQLLGSVLIEALAIGTAASALGLVAGLGFARLVGALFDAAGMGIPRDAMSLAPRTIIVASVVGVTTTLLAALAPALRATRVPPVAALQEAPPVEESPQRRRLTTTLAAVPGVLGAVLLGVGLFGDGPTTTRMAQMAGGAVLVFVGVALFARHIVRPLASTIGWPLERLFGTPAELARENAMRNPARTAVTSAALMVGLALVVFVAVLAAGLKTSIGDQLQRYVRADLIVTGHNFSPLPEGTERALASVPGITASVAMRYDLIEVNRDKRSAATDFLLGIDPRGLDDVYRFDWLDGSGATLAQLGTGEAIIEEQFARTHHVTVGGRFRVTTPSGGTTTLRAIGMYRDPTVLQGLIVTPAQLARVSPARDPIDYFLRADPDVDPAVLQAAVERALRDYPTAQVQSQLEYRQMMDDQLDQLVLLLYALLAMSVVISLFGIANSLFLSIHERTRELGMLRAIGATRRQVRRIVRYESVITSVLGGALGIVIGVTFGFLVTRALATYDIAFALPTGQLAAFLALSVVVGVIAAIAPARRGASIRILDAIQHE